MDTKKFINYYEMFELDRSWTEKELKNALGKWSVEVTKLEGSTDPNNLEERQRLRDTKQIILKAISTLSKPDRRKAYDKQLDEAIKAGTAGYEKTQEVKDTLAKARQFFNQHKYELAVKFAQEAIDQHANSDEPFEIKTRSLLMLGDYEEAIETINTGAEAFRSSVSLWWLRVRVATMLEQYDKAQIELNKAFNQFPGNAQFAAEQVYLYYHAGKDGAGKQFLDEYLRRHPSDNQFRQYVAYNLIEVANMYYKYDSEAQIMLISEEKDYQQCLKLISLANSCYQDDYTRTELEQIKSFGARSFDVDRKFMRSTYKVLLVIAVIVALNFIMHGEMAGGILCGLIALFFFISIRMINRYCIHPQWYYQRDYYRGFKTTEDSALFSLIALPFDLMVDFFSSFG